MEKIREKVNVFPIEIYEHILYFADAFTFLQAEKVCKDWKAIVERLGKTTTVWEKSCIKYIPRKFFFSILNKCDCEKQEKYEVMFRNWISWQNVTDLEFSIIDSKSEFLENVTCAKISGNHIIYGTLQGSVVVSLDSFVRKEIYEPDFKSMVIDIYFMNPVEVIVGDNYYQHSHLLVVYETKFKLFKIHPKLNEINSIDFRASKICVYDNLICMTDNQGYIEVFEVNFETTIREKILVTKTCFRFYTPIVAEYVNVFEKIITVVTKSKIYKYDYNMVTTSWKVEADQRFCLPTGSIDRYWTFYHEVIFGNGYTNLFIMTIKTVSQKSVMHTFNWMKCLGAPISEIYYYGNILFITTHAGQVYIYVIKDWVTFNLGVYDFKLYIKGRPIYTLDIQEIKNEHRLLIAMNDCIFQVFLYPKLEKITE